jgi:NAD(P)-dependent dehydrogenase (short-subunit alcohol dehydrogenase family)
LKQEPDAYKPEISYAQSKTANILFTVSLSKKLASEGITAFSLHPGGIMTNLARNIDWEFFKKQGFVDENLKPIDSPGLRWKSIPQGASTTVIAAFDPSIAERSGAYLNDGKVDDEAVKAYAIDEGNAEKLWALSEKLVGEKFTL